MLNRGLKVSTVKEMASVAAVSVPVSHNLLTTLFISRWPGVSTLKMDFVKPQGETRFTGIYNGAVNGSCEMVSVKEEGRANSVHEGVIHDFKVCGAVG